MKIINKNRIISSFAILYVMQIILQSANASSYVSVIDISEEVTSGWHQTYEAYGRKIDVNIKDIQIPDVDKIPIVEVNTFHELSPLDGVDEYSSCPTSIWMRHMPFVDTNKVQPPAGSYIIENGQAENNPLSALEAETFVRDLLHEYDKTCGSLCYQLTGILAYSRRYLNRAGRDSDVLDLDQDHPISNMGYYELYFHQLIQGVPVYNSGLNYIAPKSVKKGELAPIQTRPDGMSTATVYTTDEYYLLFAPIKEEKVVIDDTPLLPFSAILPILERHVVGGYVRDVYSLRLGYMVYDNPNNINYVLKPVWVMGCLWRFNRDKNYPDMPDDLLEQQKIMSRTAVIIDAQTGEDYVLAEKQNRKILDPGILLTWDDVK